MDIKKIKHNLDNEIGDYYDNIVMYIKALIEEGNKDEAFELLKEELNQPYVPEKTLKELETIFDECYVAPSISKQLSVEEAREALKSLDIESVVANFFTLNLRLLAEEIEYYLAMSTDYVSMSILLYTLIDQGVAMDFTITKFGQTEQFNTSKLQIVDEEILVKYQELFELKFNKEPSFVKYCSDILNYYLLVTFPFKFDSDFDLFEQIINYVLKLTGQDVEVDEDFLQIIENDME